MRQENVVKMGDSVNSLLPGFPNVKYSILRSRVKCLSVRKVIYRKTKGRNI